MEYDAHSGQLYTGGRDGCIKVWSSSHEPLEEEKELHQRHHQNHQNHQPDVVEEFEFQSPIDEEEIDVNLLKLEACISSNSLPYVGVQNDTNLSIKNNFNIHFDWINDIQLVNQNQNLVSCSSDLSIKIIDLKTNQYNKFTNNHTDYIRKLSYDSHFNANIMISGGLDGKINIWDLNSLQSLQTIHNFTDINFSLSSIYSLANFENIIATGGPSHTIHLFDKRSLSTPFIRKLIGHLDNIRCLLMNDRYVLSGSSDSSIKLWDLRTFKVFKNFDIHDYPIWALTSDKHDFSTFYSGDRSGRIVKTDISYLSSSDHISIPEFDSFNNNDLEVVNEKIGISTIIADEDSPILSLCTQGNLILSSNSKSFNQYIVPNTSDIAKYQYLRAGIDQLNNKDFLEVDDSIVQKVTTSSNQDDLNSDFYDLISHLSMDTHLDMQSTFLSNNLFDSGTPPTENPDKVDAIEEDFNSMFLDTNGGPSKEFINVYKDGNHSQLLKDSTIDETPVEILLNPIPAKNICAVPFNLKPVAEFIVEPKSVVAKRLFNNKRQLIALYLNGDIKMWDLLTCQEVRTWPIGDKPAGCLDSKQLEARTKEMDNIYQKLQTIEILNNWCEVEIKAGKLFITLKESSFLNVEIYYDDMIKHYPFLSLDHPTNAHLKDKKVKATDDDRFFLGAILLHSWFHEYSLYEWNYDASLREELRNTNKKVSESDLSSVSSLKKFKYFGKSGKPSPSSSSKLFSSKDSESTKSIDDTPDQADISKSSSVVSLTSLSDSSDDSIMKLIQSNKKFYIEKLSQINKKSGGGSIDSLLNVDIINPIIRDSNKVGCLPYYPQINAKELLPQNLQIMIFEFTPELGNYRDVSSFLMKDLNTNTMINELRLKLPKWVGLPLLYNRYNPRELPKIAFQLFECNYYELPPNKKIGGKSNKKIKRLPSLESSIKLTSHNMLRVGKILNYVTEKFESKTPEMKAGKLASDWLIFECKGIELTKDMTLQTIKTKIWKSSSDIELYFRRKFDT